MCSWDHEIWPGCSLNCPGLTQPQSAQRWACGYLRNAAGSLPQSWHTALAFHVPGDHWNAGSGVPSAHWLVGTAELIPWSTTGLSPPVQAAPTCSSRRKESKSQFGFISKGSREQWSSLNLSSTVWAERTAHSRLGSWWDVPGCTVSLQFPPVLEQDCRNSESSTAWTMQETSQPAPLSPQSWVSFSKSTGISENRAAIRPLRPGSVLPCPGH